MCLQPCKLSLLASRSIVRIRFTHLLATLKWRGMALTRQTITMTATLLELLLVTIPDLTQPRDLLSDTCIMMIEATIRQNRPISVTLTSERLILSKITLIRPNVSIIDLNSTRDGLMLSQSIVICILRTPKRLTQTSTTTSSCTDLSRDLESQL